jgi:hypothetical protein
VRKSKTKGSGLDNVNQTGSKRRLAAKTRSLSAEALFWLAAHFEPPEGKRRESISSYAGLYSRVE